MAVQVARVQRQPEEDGLGKALKIGSLAAQFFPGVGTAVGAGLGIAGQMRDANKAQEAANSAMDRRVQTLQTDPLRQLQQGQELLAGVQDPELRKKYAAPLVQAEMALRRGGVA